MINDIVSIIVNLLKFIVPILLVAWFISYIIKCWEEAKNE